MKNKTLKVFEAFAGVGSQHMALRNIGCDYEIVGISEIDKFAIQSYNAIHGETKNYGDISQLDPNDLPDMDLFTYSFPCTDISSAGRQEGFAKGSGTRSSLLWECEKVIDAKRPKLCLMENVKALVSKKYLEQFHVWLKIMADLGYTNYWQVTNATDCGIPQNRERVFLVSIHGDHNPYEFPIKQELTTSVRDYLLPIDEVPEKFFLKQWQIDRFKFDPKYTGIIKQTGSFKTREDAIGQRAIVYGLDGGIGTFTATDYKDPKKLMVAGRLDLDGWRECDTRVFDPISHESLAPALTTQLGGSTKKKFVYPLVQTNDGGMFDAVTGNPVDSSDIPVGTEIQVMASEQDAGINVVGQLDCDGWLDTDKRVYDSMIDGNVMPTLPTQGGSKTKKFFYPLIAASRGRYFDAKSGKRIDKEIAVGNTIQMLEPRLDGCSNTLTTVQKDNYVVANCYTIRKIMPLESWRLMGFSDEDFNKAKDAGLSDTQLYKQAGNSIVVNCLEGIFAQMLKSIENCD